MYFKGRKAASAQHRRLSALLHVSHISAALGWTQQPERPEVFKAVYHAYGFCSVEEGLKSSYLCPWLLSFLHKNSQILSLSLSSHLGNSNLFFFLPTVGAGRHHEILKSTSPALTSPLTFYTPSPSSIFQWNALQSSTLVVKSLLL